MIRRDETVNIRAVVEMKMEGKRPRGRPKLGWNDTVRTDMKAWNIREEWATDRERWKGLHAHYSAQGDGGEGEKVMPTDTSLNFDTSLLTGRL